MTDLPLLHARRYIQPLREGGSLPAVVDTEDGLYVVKFRGAGQGPKALVAELVVGLLGRGLDLPVPDLALVDVAPTFGRTEGDPEIQDLLRASHGVNVGMRYLDGAFNFDVMAAGELVSEELAAELVWFDAWLTNPDRTARNPNLLVWQRRPWLIDHGAALYAHHDWSRVDEARTRGPFPNVRDHVLLAASGDLRAADARMMDRLAGVDLAGLVAAVPDLLLEERDGSMPPAAARERYVRYLTERAAEPRAFLEEAVRAKASHADGQPRRLRARR